MILRCMKIEELRFRLEMKDTGDLALSATENRDTNSSLEALKHFESVFQNLQKANRGLLHIKDFYDILELYSIRKQALSPTAKIILNNMIESAAVMIQLVKSAQLSAAGSCSVKHLLETPTNRVAASVKTLHFDEKALKKQSLESDSLTSTSQYIDPELLIPASNVWRRLFSKATIILDG